ncbi:pre-mRNA processing factor 3-domain-containing protein [Schizophyllum amplum]|uniref:Pre-mRNA processing factor 3-domain-containing protein n=1 Tax=Schizophyllum amplum TaxID=97359 RepID=A0A550C6F0_9AGAR|nr:pre-mRNA processing factor 3-domain-containing protein [Auriculariopsis ampla]
MSKRPLDTNGDAKSNKKLKRCDNVPSNGSKAALSPAELIAQKRAEVAAKLASMKNLAAGGAKSGGLAAPQPIRVTAPLPAKPMATPSPATPGTPGASDDLARRIAEAKRLVANAQTKLAVKDNPYMSVAQANKKRAPPAPEPTPVQQGAGLKMAAHPLLLDQTPAVPQSKKDRYKPMQPKFASIKANARNIATPTPPPTAATPAPVTAVANPYAAASANASSAIAKSDFTGAPRQRSGRQFRFNPKGKYVAQGDQLRQEIKLEELKQKIADSARKAGLDGDAVMGIGSNVRRPPPPDAEWWDAALLPNKKYDDLEEGFAHLHIRNPDSPITIYVQHPIAIPAPGDKEKIALKPLMLTTKEQKKMRRLRRKAEQQDKRDRIKMGLLPPDPPKVRLANLMKVLTSDAVQDPTKVEAKVRREVANRKLGHEKMNAERKLTDDQRREKITAKQAEEDRKGVWGAVYKVLLLRDKAHQFKVRKNAQQNGLTGITIFHPAFSLVYVEGAAKFMRKYRRLMTERIAWTQAAAPRGAEEVELEGEEEGGTPAAVAKPEGEADGEEGAVNLENNACYLVWEGPIRDRAFSDFKGKAAPTDGLAKDVLGEKLKGYWDMAKNFKPEEEELF